jgi:hypothetical protein
VTPGCSRIGGGHIRATARARARSPAAVVEREFGECPRCSGRKRRSGPRAGVRPDGGPATGERPDASPDPVVTTELRASGRPSLAARASAPRGRAPGRRVISACEGAGRRRRPAARSASGAACPR